MKWQLGSGNGSHPTNPVRAELATQFLVEDLGDAVVVDDPSVVGATCVRSAIESVHDVGFVARVIDEGVSSEWSGNRIEMGVTALNMFAGTQILVEGMLAEGFRVGFNPQGAKHHAHYDHASGFCVFNDMAWAAKEFERNGLRPIYVDWDIHAGDGVQHLLEDTSIPTLSIHNHSIYPGEPEMIDIDMARAGVSHTAHKPERAIYNWGINREAGDEALAWAIESVVEVVREYKPDVILLAAGADGHAGDSNLGEMNNYSYAGFDAAATAIGHLATEFSQGLVLIGGAGGYQPLDHTPRIWANVVERIYRTVQLAS